MTKIVRDQTSSWTGVSSYSGSNSESVDVAALPTVADNARGQYLGSTWNEFAARRLAQSSSLNPLRKEGWTKLRMPKTSTPCRLQFEAPGTFIAAHDGVAHV